MLKIPQLGESAVNININIGETRIFNFLSDFAIEEVS